MTMSRTLAAICRSVVEKQWRELGFAQGFGSLKAAEQEWRGCLGLEEVKNVLNDVKAGNVRVILVGRKCGWADHLVVAMGKLEWHVRNIAQALIYKLDFIWYHEDVETRRPVRWDFFKGMSQHAITFEVGVVLPDPAWQAPAYCFDESESQDDAAQTKSPLISVGSLDMFRQLSLLDVKKASL